jgi:hypothetical protein
VACQLERRERVEGEALADGIGVLVDKPMDERHTGVVHQDVDRPALVLDPGQQAR